MRIVPFLSRRCVSRPDKKDFAKKRERFMRIAEEAAKQSGRGIIPEIGELMSFDEAVKDMSAAQIKLICYENGGQKLSGIDLMSADTAVRESRLLKLQTVLMLMLSPLRLNTTLMRYRMQGSLKTAG